MEQCSFSSHWPVWNLMGTPWAHTLNSHYIPVIDDISLRWRLHNVRESSLWPPTTFKSKLLFWNLKWTISMMRNCGPNGKTMLIFKPMTNNKLNGEYTHWIATMHLRWKLNHVNIVKKWSSLWPPITFNSKLLFLKLQMNNLYVSQLQTGWNNNVHFRANWWYKT